MNRRDFSKYLLGLGISGVSKADNCAENIDIVAHDNIKTCPDEQFLHWLDGLYFDNYDSTKSRAQLAILLKFPQNPDAYIDKVVLSDSEKNILGVRYFDENSKITNNFPPYIIFEQLSLDPSEAYAISFQRWENEQRVVYRKTLSRPKRSRLRGTHLGQIDQDLKQSAHKGMVTSPLEFNNKLNPSLLNQHLCEARIISLDQKNNFSIEIKFMHQDIDPKHHMRYFIVTDPVGRVLGLKKRTYAPAEPTKTVVTSLTDRQRQEHFILPPNVAKINDCNFIQVFTEDFLSCSRTIIYLT